MARNSFTKIPGNIMRVSALLALTISAGDAARSDPIAGAAQADNFQAICRPNAMQAIASTISSTRVTVQQLPPVPEFKEGSPQFEGGVQYFPATDTLPAFCQVTGSFVTNPQTGKTANFLATFPANWNGKYLQIGCGGHCGFLMINNPANPMVVTSTQGTPGQIIRKGYAAFATDEGHVGMSAGKWAIKESGQVNEDAIADFFYRASKLLAPMGKEFTRAVYARSTGSKPTIAKSYFAGCSNGGRDALVAASYYPEEFDGIIAGSPYNLAGRSFHAAGASLATIRTPDAGISPAQLTVFNKAVTAQCDAVDGVKDGLIQNPAACNFRPERDLPRCEAGKSGDQCFTNTQIETLSTVLTAVTDDQGAVVQPGFSVSDLGRSFAPPVPPQDASAESPWEDNVTGGDWALGNSVIKLFVHKNDPTFKTRSIISLHSGGQGPIKDYRIVVPRAEVTKALTEGRMGIGHFPENAAKLIKQNRKLLLWHNLSDERLTPYMSINYYKQLAKLHGGYSKLQANVRFFSLPGTAHCGGGGLPVGPNSFDPLTAMENWVEKGAAPDAIPARLYQPTPFSLDFSKPLGRTMPLCKFPEMARYKGAGDVNDAANWSCPSGDASMLKIGESGRRAGVMK